MEPSFTLHFEPMRGTSIPVDTVVSYIDSITPITTSPKLWEYLIANQITDIDLCRINACYGLYFDLVHPFPHHLSILPKEEGIVGLIALVHGTEYEEKTVELLIHYDFIKSREIYYAWKRGLSRFQ